MKVADEGLTFARLLAAFQRGARRALLAAEEGPRGHERLQLYLGEGSDFRALRLAVVHGQVAVDVAGDLSAVYILSAEGEKLVLREVLFR